MEEEIESICRKYLNNLYKTSLKYKTNSIFDNTDFRADRGDLSFDDCSKVGVWVRYRDSWSYGGNCDEKFYITFKEVDSFDETTLEKKSIQDSRRKIERDICNLEKQVEAAKQSLIKFDTINNLL